MDANSGAILDKSAGYWPFYPGEPNGGTLENCATIWAARGAWNDYQCRDALLGFCMIQAKPRFKIRGNAIQSSFMQAFNIGSL